MIRLAHLSDAAAVAAIYAPYVLQSAATFEEFPPTPAEMEERREQVLAHFPWLIYEDGDGVAGYCYATAHRPRAGYRWSVDVSVYVHQDRRGGGIGRRLYRDLFERLRQLGCLNVCAGIALPNDASVALHEAFGMRQVALYPHIGYKFGQWHDVGWWQGELAPRTSPPAELSGWLEEAPGGSPKLS